MTKKILLILIVSLFFILIGLVVLYLHFARPNKQVSDVLQFIPESTVLIVRIDDISESLTVLFQSEELNQNFNISDLRRSWDVIDSISSRNYKTADILSSGTSFICADSTGDYLILLDIQKKANAHFIDQFLAHNSPQQRIHKHENGLKSFTSITNDTLYYFLRDNVFGLSSCSELALQSLNTTKLNPDSNLYTWQQQSKSSISVYVKHSTPSLRKYFSDENRWFQLTESISSSYWFDVMTNSSGIILEGELTLDSIQAGVSQWNVSVSENSIYYDFIDSFVLASGYFQFNIPDTTGGYKPCMFHYIEFVDSLDQHVNFMVSEDSLALAGLEQIKADTSVQIIPMADPDIKQVLAVDVNRAKWLVPYYPLKTDSAKYLITGINNYLIVSTNMESILFYAKIFPFKFLKLSKNHENNWLRYKQRGAKYPNQIANIQFRKSLRGKVRFIYGIGPPTK